MTRRGANAAASETSGERARLIATADLFLASLRELRARQQEGADVAVVERWIVRVAGLRALLDTTTDRQGVEPYDVNRRHPGEALRRLFPVGLDDGDFDDEVGRLQRASEDFKRLAQRPPLPPMTADDGLDDLLNGHASARFRYIDVRSVEAWRRERLSFATNIPLARLSDEAPKLFAQDSALVVFGDDDATTREGVRLLEQAGFSALPIPGGFDWFRRRNWTIDRGPAT